MFLEGQTPALQAETANVSTFMEFSQRMLENLFNFASSFAVSASDMRQRPGKTFTYLSFSKIFLVSDWIVFVTFKR
jgi:hypothetical protein